jgi:hypothetical protein
VTPGYQARWRSAPLGREVGVARWGEAGPPLRLSLDFHYASPLHFLPYLEDDGHLELLRGRFVRLVCGRGRAERPEYPYRVARVLGRKGIPNRVDVRGSGYHHDWPTWRATLPLYLEELFPPAGAAATRSSPNRTVASERIAPASPAPGSANL